MARLPTSEGNPCQLAGGTHVPVPTISYWGVAPSFTLSDPEHGLHA